MSPKKPAPTLFRGDDSSSVAVPTPTAKRLLVSHILYEGGMGRETQWTSTTDSEATAERFSRSKGKVWRTDAPKAVSLGASYLSKHDLLQLLKGYGKGKAKWDNPVEVAQARAYVLQWDEHLLDWSGHTSIQAAIKAAFR